MKQHYIPLFCKPFAHVMRCCDKHNLSMMFSAICSFEIVPWHSSEININGVHTFSATQKHITFYLSIRKVHNYVCNCDLV